MPLTVAIGTFFLGFSTASALAAADSKPRNPQRVREIDCLTASKKGTSFGFQAAIKVSGLNQNHPIVLIAKTGRIDPQTVILLSRPVKRLPLKFKIAANQSNTIVT